MMLENFESKLSSLTDALRGSHSNISSLTDALKQFYSKISSLTDELEELKDNSASYCQESNSMFATMKAEVAKVRVESLYVRYILT